MRNLLLISSLVLIGSSMNYAQENRFGMKTGVVASSMGQVEVSLGPVEFNWSGNNSYSAGLFVNRRLYNLISLQVEMDYKRVGAHATSPDYPEGTKINYEFEYIGFSVMPRIDLFPESRLNPNFMIGPYADLRLESDLTISLSSGSAGALFDSGFLGADTKPYTNTQVFGIAMAGGIEFKTEPVILTLEGRFSSSFSNVFNESVEELQLNGDNLLLKLVENAKHEYVSILIGFNFYF